MQFADNIDAVVATIVSISDDNSQFMSNLFIKTLVGRLKPLVSWSVRFRSWTPDTEGSTHTRINAVMALIAEHPIPGVSVNDNMLYS